MKVELVDKSFCVPCCYMCGTRIKTSGMWARCYEIFGEYLICDNCADKIQLAAPKGGCHAADISELFELAEAAWHENQLLLAADAKGDEMKERGEW